MLGLDTLTRKILMSKYVLFSLIEGLKKADFVSSDTAIDESNTVDGIDSASVIASQNRDNSSESNYVLFSTSSFSLLLFCYYC